MKMQCNMFAGVYAVQAGSRYCRAFEKVVLLRLWKIWVKIPLNPWQLNKNYIFAVKF